MSTTAPAASVATFKAAVPAPTAAPTATPASASKAVLLNASSSALVATAA